MFREFTDIPNLEEEDYDIKSAYNKTYNEENNINNPQNSNEEEVYEEEITMEPVEENPYNMENIENEELYIEEDIFEDDNIETTLKKYNYDYKVLLRELTTLIDYSRLLEILNECGISKEEYQNPTYVTFEKIRDKIIHSGKTK